MDDKNKDFLPEEDLLPEEPLLMEEPVPDLPIPDEEPLPEEFPELITGDFSLGALILPEDDNEPTETPAPPSTLYSSGDGETMIFTPVPAVEPEEVPGDAFFTTPTVGEEIFADEHAMAGHDLTHPNDLDDDFGEPDFPDTAFLAPDEENKDFDAAFHSAPADKQPASRVRPPRKGRPKRKKGYGLFGIPHLLATAVWLAIILAIGVSLGRMLWLCAADVLAFGREDKAVTVTITTNDTIDDIANKLHDADLIRYPGLFKLYAGFAVDEGDIVPGTFALNTLYDYHALVVMMGPGSSSRSVISDVLIPEGYNCRQIFELLEQQGICTVAELEEYAANGEFQDFWFLEGVERGDKYCLEGFLFPDTYDFYANSTPREALGKMLLGFNARIKQEEITAQLETLNGRLSAMMRAKGCSEEYITEHQLSLRDLLIVASLIEEETASTSESPTIASVIFNRLTEDQAYERYLNIDAAIIYATGDANSIDTGMDHPYNTYKNPGLTPGPISNPGLDSINAALNFADTKYYYYVLNPETDTHQFSKTLEEHEQWVEKFRGTGE